MDTPRRLCILMPVLEMQKSYLSRSHSQEVGKRLSKNRLVSQREEIVVGPKRGTEETGTSETRIETVRETRREAKAEIVTDKEDPRPPLRIETAESTTNPPIALMKKEITRQGRKDS